MGVVTNFTETLLSLVTANHTSFLDGFLMGYLTGGVFVSRRENDAIPIFGTIVKVCCHGCCFVTLLVIDDDEEGEPWVCFCKRRDYWSPMVI